METSYLSPAPSAKELAAQLPPTALVIFGATGDLAANYLLPALSHLLLDGLLPQSFSLICVGRREFNTQTYLDFMAGKSQSLQALKSGPARQKFLKQLTYYRGDFDDPASFRGLAEKLSDKDGARHACVNRLFYFATSPEFFQAITTLLDRSGLLATCQRHHRNSRVLVEKPFGVDLPSAKKLNQLLLKYFGEDQIYRIDHYQGKETVQNLMVVRFANVLFEPLWKAKGIDHVEISVLEQERVGARVPFYDAAGAARDMLQNHVLQMLSLIAMDEPAELSAELIRDEKLKILKALRPMDKKTAAANIVRAQYAGYEHELGKESGTETFVALKAYVDRPRWKGVPFYLRTGKALTRRVAEISVHFKELPRCLFRNCAANILTFRIQPDERVQLKINNKVPGFGIELHHANLDFGYKDAFAGQLPSAYERLLLDFVQGDQRLFIRSDEIEAAWKFIDSLRGSWDSVPLAAYAPGTDGPMQAAALIDQDGREWLTK